MTMSAASFLDTFSSHILSAFIVSCPEQFLEWLEYVRLKSHSLSAVNLSRWLVTWDSTHECMLRHLVSTRRPATCLETWRLLTVVLSRNNFSCFEVNSYIQNIHKKTLLVVIFSVNNICVQRYYGAWQKSNSASYNPKLQQLQCNLTKFVIYLISVIIVLYICSINY